MEEVPEWLLYDHAQVHQALEAGQKVKAHQIADLAAMANVPGLAVGQAREAVVKQTHQYASQVGQTPHHTTLYAVGSALQSWQSSFSANALLQAGDIAVCEAYHISVADSYESTCQREGLSNR